MLNEQLAKEMGLSESRKSWIKELQSRREDLKIEMAQKMNGTVKEKTELLGRFRTNEKQLQEAWGFSDNTHLRFMQELKISGCNCPYFDNKDGRGLVRYKSETCKWHNL